MINLLLLFSTCGFEGKSNYLSKELPSGDFKNVKFDIDEWDGVFGNS